MCISNSCNFWVNYRSLVGDKMAVSFSDQNFKSKVVTTDGIKWIRTSKANAQRDCSKASESLAACRSCRAGRGGGVEILQMQGRHRAPIEMKIKERKRAVCKLYSLSCFHPKYLQLDRHNLYLWCGGVKTKLKTSFIPMLMIMTHRDGKSQGLFVRHSSYKQMVRERECRPA